ncbi:MAG TPA: tetratricopeptide repeat protein [Aeromonadales bacterium]|nr:tetratricopeptide repeat protein [Aeromonadales bacterium]
MKKIIYFSMFFLAACSTQSPNTKNLDRPEDEKISHLESTMDKVQQALLNKNQLKAIELLEPEISRCEKQYPNQKSFYRIARSTKESLIYLLGAAKNESKIELVQDNCAEANYYMAYTYSESGDFSKAKKYLIKALAWSPLNATYTAELAYIYQKEKNMNVALELFKKSEINAENYSPDILKVEELTRAKRGIGYILIEKGELDKAREKYLECLKLNANDASALNELEYIGKLEKQ